jgi:hypothetical protein
MRFTNQWQKRLFIPESTTKLTALTNTKTIPSIRAKTSMRLPPSPNRLPEGCAGASGRPFVPGKYKSTRSAPGKLPSTHGGRTGLS